MSPTGQTYERLRGEIDPLDVIDCHEHTIGPSEAPKYTEPIASLTMHYFHSDLVSASSEAEAALLADANVPTDKKWPTFERLWKRTEHTGYARVTKWILANEYGLAEVTLEGLKSIADRLVDFTEPDAYDAYLGKHNIRCRLVNIWIDWRKFLAGEHELPPRDRVMIGLPDYHGVRGFEQIAGIAGRSDERVTSLDEYLDVCRRQFERMKELGAAGFKDQSAYGRGIAFDNPPRADGERLFNLVMEDPRRALGWPEAKPLSDFLFHEFLRMARDMDLPVQIHTGHMAGVRNDITKTNAALLTKVLELHRDVRFDLFHGNWPYAGEWLYLGKNYPNVALDCCWLHIIDPRYAKRVLADALVTVPHAKVHGFGGDYGDYLEYAAGHLAIAKDNIAAALAEMVDDGWIGLDEARRIAADWLFNNPNEFFRLGFEPIGV